MEATPLERLLRYRRDSPPGGARAKIAFVSESHPKGGYPLDRASGDRLARLLGLADCLELVERHDCFHLMRRVPRTWHAPAARRRAADLATTLAEYSGVVLLGSRVRRAFGVPVAAAWLADLGDQVVVFPNPSDRCRAWGVPELGLRAGEVLRDLLVPTQVRRELRSLGAFRDIAKRFAYPMGPA